MTTTPQPIPPDTKDWTWVLRRPCPDCGFEASSVSGPDVADVTRRYAAVWSEVLAGPDATRRPAPTVWSPLEYACHVRDVCALFAARVTSMLTEDDPLFGNWNQDDTARADRYWVQKPHIVDAELQTAAEVLAEVYHQVGADQWERTGRRDDGSAFTVETLGQYFLHDLVHHVYDVGADAGSGET